MSSSCIECIVHTVGISITLIIQMRSLSPIQVSLLGSQFFQCILVHLRKFDINLTPGVVMGFVQYKRKSVPRICLSLLVLNLRGYGVRTPSLSTIYEQHRLSLLGCP